MSRRELLALLAFCIELRYDLVSPLGRKRPLAAWRRRTERLPMPASKQPIYHPMWTLYVWWLRNDLRGSTSRAFRNDLIAELGELPFVRWRA
jgi:hypothetical protein